MTLKITILSVASVACLSYVICWIWSNLIHATNDSLIDFFPTLVTHLILALRVHQAVEHLL